jgi:SOS-response transcriptional repressor LexA
VATEWYKSLLPLYSLKAAAGYFGKGEHVEPEGWMEAEWLGTLDERMFVAKAVGRSMEPKIHDGDYCVFRADPVGTKQGKIVLAKYRGPADPDTGGSFTVKRYSSEKIPDPDGDWRHTKVTLSPINPAFQPIILTPESEGDVHIVAEFLDILGRA